MTTRIHTDNDLINALLNMLNENKIDKFLIRKEVEKILKRMNNYKKGDILDPDSKIRLQHDKDFISNVITVESSKDKESANEELSIKSLDKLSKYMKSTEKS